MCWEGGIRSTGAGGACGHRQACSPLRCSAPGRNGVGIAMADGNTKHIFTPSKKGDTCKIEMFDCQSRFFRGFCTRQKLWKTSPAFRNVFCFVFCLRLHHLCCPQQHLQGVTTILFSTTPSCHHLSLACVVYYMVSSQICYGDAWGKPALSKS